MTSDEEVTKVRSRDDIDISDRLRSSAIQAV